MSCSTTNPFIANADELWSSLYSMATEQKFVLSKFSLAKFPARQTPRVLDLPCVLIDEIKMPYLLIGYVQQQDKVYCQVISADSQIFLCDANRLGDFRNH